MHKYLPSKKFIFIILSIIIALLIIFGVSFLGKKETVTLQINRDENTAKIKEFMALDSDNDNLKDWEEALWKTDPKNPDTDADGTMDGDEINANRDPLKANTAAKGQEPNDKIDEKIITSNTKIAEEFNKLSETEKMGQMFFSQYVATKKFGQSLSQDEISNIIVKTLTELPSVSLKQYSLSNILTSPIYTQDTIRDYGNNIAKILLDNLFSDKLAAQDYDFYGLTEISNLMQSIQNITDSKERTLAFEKLDPIISQYKLIINGLLKVTAPNQLAEKHLALINAFCFIYDDLSQIKNASNNPALLPSIFANYSNNVNDFLPTIISTAKIFKDNNIVFNSGEFGATLFNGIIK